ncbi:hypothetical protein FEV09_23835, partial [Pseudanabaena catenata USMAC16]
FRIGSPACSPNLVVSPLVGNLGVSVLLFLAFLSSKNGFPVQKRSTKTTLIPNPQYSRFHSLRFPQFFIL